MHAPFGVTSATPQLGPIVMCPLNGNVYVAETMWAAEASAPSTLPVFTRVADTDLPALSSARICLYRFPLPDIAGEPAQVTFSRAEGWIASYSFVATPPRKSPLRTPCPPAMCLIELSSTDTTGAPLPYMAC